MMLMPGAVHGSQLHRISICEVSAVQSDQCIFHDCSKELVDALPNTLCELSMLIQAYGFFKLPGEYAPNTWSRTGEVPVCIREI